MNDKRIEAIIGKMLTLASPDGPVAGLLNDFIDLRKIDKHRLLERQCTVAAFAGLIAHYGGRSHSEIDAREVLAITLGKSLARTLRRVEEDEDVPLHEGIKRGVEKARKGTKPRAKRTR